MTFTDTYGRRLPALKPIRVRPIEPTDPALYRKLSAAEWDAEMSAKYGDDWDATDRDIQLWEQSNG